MKTKIEELKKTYEAMREQTRSMKHYVNDSDDIIKLDAGIVTFDLVIADLQKILSEEAVKLRE